LKPDALPDFEEAERRVWRSKSGAKNTGIQPTHDFEIYNSFILSILINTDYTGNLWETAQDAQFAGRLAVARDTA
jgi:hypothetical protein